jgi:hypothetical protein
MKKILTTIAVVATASFAFAQGTINTTPSNLYITGQTNSEDSINPLNLGLTATGSGAVGNTGSGATSGLHYDYALLYETTTFSGPIGSANVFDGTWQFTGITFTNASAAGRLNAVQATANTVPWAAGTTQSVVLVGWSTDLGTAWAGVSGVSNLLATGTFGSVLAGANGFFGESALGYLTGNASPAPGAQLFQNGDQGNGLPIYSLNTQLYLLPVPEPATMALAGLGGLSLLLFRRQRK